MQPHRSLLIIPVLALSVLALSCGGSAPPTPECFLAQDGQVVGAVGADCEPPPGETVLPTPTFTPVPANGGSDNGRALFITYACATCHTLDSIPQATGTDGPALTGIGSKGADYIRASIIDPSAEVVEGYADGLMPQDFATQLSADELDTLVTFLSSQ